MLNMMWLMLYGYPKASSSSSLHVLSLLEMMLQLTKHNEFTWGRDNSIGFLSYRSISRRPKKQWCSNCLTFPLLVISSSS